MKRVGRGLVLLALAVLVSATMIIVAGCGSESSARSDGRDPGAAVDGAPFKVGVVGPMTGRGASYGAAQKAGAEIAVEELNAAGGVNGAGASVVIGDDRGDPKLAAPVARRFIDDPEIVAVDAHLGFGAAPAAGRVYIDAGLPVIAPSTSEADGARPGAFCWRIRMSSAPQAGELATYCVNVLDKKRVAVVYENSNYGRGVAGPYEKAMAAAGGVVVDRQRYTVGETDFRLPLTKIRRGAPELVFIAGHYREAAKIVVQARAAGMNVQFLGADGCASDELPRLGGAAAEGMLVAANFDASQKGGEVRRFVKVYRAAHNGADPDWIAANSYDVVMIMAAAAKKAAKNDRGSLNAALATLGEYHGVSGTFTFAERGEISKHATLVVVQDGELVTVSQQLQ